MRPSSWVPPVAWMAVIAVLSTGWFGGRHTETAVVGLLAWIAPWIPPADAAALHATVRKGAHFVEYAVLALLWFRALVRDTPLPHGWAVAATLGICLAWAALDEGHQSLAAGRTGSAGDVAIDAAGALTALAVARRGWLRTARALTSLLLWVAAAGGAVVLAIDLATGVPSGYLWLTAPAAALALIARRWWTGGAWGAPGAPHVTRPSGEGRGCHADRRRRD